MKRLIGLLMTGLFSLIFISATAQVVTVNLGTKKQIIRHFGASDCWQAQFVGNWPDAKRNAMADLLFSTGKDANGKPLGIGLSMWRFNIGAGSTEQGGNSDISNEWRRAECFRNADGTYNWTKQAGQRWFLRAAKARNVPYYTAFCNSPPVSLTKNGLANTTSGETNIAAANYNAFGDFLSNVVTNINTNEGVKFDYVSPFNEPQWDWMNGQEGCPIRNNELAPAITAISSRFVANGVTSKIHITEAAQIDFLYSGSTSKSDRDDQWWEFFGTGPYGSVGKLSNIDHSIGGHSYFTCYPSSTAVSKRQSLRSKNNEIDNTMEYWQTEYCVLEDNAEITGTGKTTSAKTALWIARVIHNDLVYAFASSWSWWTALSSSDYKDGLIYVDKITTDGNYSVSKNLWALGHYSYFIRPGSYRVSLSGTGVNINNQDSLLVSGYYHPTTKQVVVVAINYSTANMVFKVATTGGTVSTYAGYSTSDTNNENMSPIGNFVPNTDITIKARSIMTLVGTAITNVAVTGVSVSPTTQTLTVGGTQQLTATVAPTDATNKTVSWTTNNATVATVSTSGLITAVAAGTATITVSTQDGGKIATCNVTVNSTATTTTLNPSADADIYQGGSTNNYGTATTLRTKCTSGSTVTRKTYMKFDLASAGFSSISNAKVRLYCSALDGTYNVTAYQQITDSWTETGLTWATAPTLGTAIVAVSINGTAKYFEWDVTSYVNSQNSGDKVVSICFADAGTAGLLATFNSKEVATNKPELVVTGISNTLKAIKVLPFENLNSETSEQFVSVYPNPLNHDKLTIKLEGYQELDNAEVIISNLQGQIVYQKLIPNNKTLEINTIGLLKSSIYLVSVRSGKLITNTKLIVDQR